jgi:hypothetical protein
MTIKLDPKKITQLLDQSTRQLDGEILSALQQSRAQALQRQSTPVQVLGFAGDGWTHLPLPRSARQWITIGLLALALASGANLWWQHTRHQQIIDTDVEILTDELPIELFVD